MSEQLRHHELGCEFSHLFIQRAAVVCDDAIPESTETSTLR